MAMFGTRRAGLGLAVLAIGATAALAAHAESTAPQGTESTELTEQIIVIGKRNTVPGSGTVIDRFELERFDHVDVNQVMSSLPGVYVREEDGFGLRPNIGIRGAAAERSQKITLLSDGVPVAPAVYSAPAAYYMPNISRMHAVEVLKGPSAIHHGPHTVGGAINFVTRPVPTERSAELDVSLGNNGFHKLVATYGDLGERRGFLVEALRYGSGGFKELDGGGPTGFVRNDLGAKLLWTPSSVHRVAVRAGYADEASDETYLGLTDDDFRASPHRRYAASQLDRFVSEHVHAHLNYGFQASDVIHLNAKAYWHRFDRDWNKLDGLFSGRDLQRVLATPNRFVREYSLLTGTVDSLPTDAQTLDVTNNSRQYSTAGVQATAVMTLETGDIGHRLTVGTRLHRDDVERHHMPRGYLMQSGRLVFDGRSRRPKALNRAETEALAVFASEELTWRDATLTLGLRHESIAGEFEDLRHDGSYGESSQEVTSPGAGVHWQLTESLSVLAGAYQGFSPAGPGSRATPERSVNYEYGFRYFTAPLNVEVVGFLSDYDNLLGRCRVSDAGCEPGDEFNAGRVEVSGVEVTASATHQLTDTIRLDADVVYTHTASAFKTSFLSGFSQWGFVSEDDELPYLPTHRAQFRLGLSGGAWDILAAFKHQSPMREEPGVDDVEGGLHADGLTTVDVVGTWRPRASTRLQVIVGNVTDKAAIVAHRPFGARPNRPRWLAFRVRQSF